MPVPSTLSVTTRGMKIVVDGRTVGLIQNFSMSQTRDVQRIFEINADSDGNCIEIVPGNISGLSVTVNRVELYTQALEEAFGIADPSMLTNQDQPFDLHEVYTRPDGVKYGYVYHGCWFSDTGRESTAEGTRIVTRNATIQATYVTLMGQIS